MLRSENGGSTTKTLLYTISFVFLFLFMEYSLNYISSSSSSFGNMTGDNNHTQSFESIQFQPNDTSLAALSASLIGKEKLLIEKEEKYVVALQKLNERDLKLNYVDEQLYKLQSLLNKYKVHTKNLQEKLFNLQSKLNQTKQINDQTHKFETEPEPKQLKQPYQVQGYHDDEIESLLDQTRKQILIKENKIDVEKVIKIEEKDKIIDKHEDVYVLSNRKSSLNSNTQMVDFRLIWDLGVVLIAATFGGIVASLFNQPLILGYLLGGSLIGPGGLKLINQYIQVETLAHVGSVFLLFYVGMEYKFNKIRKYLKICILSLALCGAMLYLVCYVWFYWLYADFNAINVTIFVFASLNTSTTVVLKTLTDLYEHNHYDESRRIIVAILLVQDIYFIFFMAIFSSVTQQQKDNENTFIYKLLMVLIVLIIIFKALPHLLSYLRRLISIDIYILFTVSVCIIFTLISQNIFESSGLGAFTAGLLIAKSSPDSDQLLKKNWKPIRNIFGVLFFASIGMLINPQFLWINCYAICSLCLFVGIAKFAMIYVSVYVLQKRSHNLALNVSTPLAFQGEFAFVLSAHAHFDHLITKNQHTVLLGSTAISLLITPFVIRHSTHYFVRMYGCIYGTK
eukprot:56314_1